MNNIEKEKRFKQNTLKMYNDTIIEALSKGNSNISALKNERDKIEDELYLLYQEDDYSVKSSEKSNKNSFFDEIFLKEEKITDNDEKNEAMNKTQMSSFIVNMPDDFKIKSDMISALKYGNEHTIGLRGEVMLSVYDHHGLLSKIIASKDRRIGNIVVDVINEDENESDKCYTITFINCKLINFNDVGFDRSVKKAREIVLIFKYSEIEIDG